MAEGLAGCATDQQIRFESRRQYFLFHYYEVSRCSVTTAFTLFFVTRFFFFYVPYQKIWFSSNIYFWLNRYGPKYKSWFRVEEITSSLSRRDFFLMKRNFPFLERMALLKSLVLPLDCYCREGGIMRRRCMDRGSNLQDSIFLSVTLSCHFYYK